MSDQTPDNQGAINQEPPRTIQVDATPPPSSTEDSTEDAPYGRRADGTPRKKPGPPPGTNVRAPAAKKTTSSKKTAKGKIDYRPAVTGPLQVAGMLLAMGGTRDKRFLADAAAVGMHAEPIAAAVSDLANDNPAIAAVLDKVAQVGPYGALMTAVAPLVIQIATNHGVMPEAVSAGFGAVPPEALISQVEAEAAEYERAMRADANGS